MNAGNLKHRITFQMKQRTQDPDTGAIIEKLQDVPELTNIFASVEFLSVREKMRANQLDSNITARVTIRYRDYPFTHDMKLVHKGIVYDIDGFIPDNVTGNQHITIPIKRSA